MNLLTARKTGPHLSAEYCPTLMAILSTRHLGDISEPHGKGVPGEAKLHHLGALMVWDNETSNRNLIRHRLMLRSFTIKLARGRIRGLHG